MNRLSIGVLFGTILVVAAWWIVDTTSPLSGPVASQFSFGGRASSFMSGGGYRWFMLFFTVALPALVAWAVGGLPRLAPNHTNIPHRVYWMAPERREETLHVLSRHGLWLGILMTVFSCALHWLILRANRQQPPTLEMNLFWIVMGAFLAAVGLWALTLTRRFGKPPKER